MDVAGVGGGRAKLKGGRWVLLAATAHRGLGDELRALLPDGAAVGPCLLREARFKPGRKITAYYDALVNTENPEGHHVRPIAVTWRPSTRADRNAEHEDTLGLAKIQAEAVRHGVAAPFLGLMADLPSGTCIYGSRHWIRDSPSLFVCRIRFTCALCSRRPTRRVMQHGISVVSAIIRSHP